MRGTHPPPASTPSRHHPWATAALAAACLLFGGCLDNPGIDPPVATLHFPIALTLHGDVAYVANSNFDLRYNAGSLHAYDMNALAPCAEDCRSDDGCVILPTQADPSDADDLVIRAEPCEGLLTGEVLMGSFTSGLAVSPSGQRVYLTSRSEADLTHIETDSAGRLACGGEPGTRHRCTEHYRESNRAIARERNLVLPLDPVGLHVGDLGDRVAGLEGDYAVVGHRNNAVSLFMDVDGRPALVNVLTGVLPVPEDEPVNLENLLWHERTERAWTPSSTGGLMGRVGLVTDPDDPLQSFLFNAGAMPVTGATDTRDVKFDPRPGVQRAYVLARQPAALMMLDLDAHDTIESSRSIALCAGGGPSRMELATIADRMIAFVSCFDSPRIFPIDVDRNMLLDTTTGGQGPFNMAVDEARGLLLVTDFINGTLRVQSLATLTDCLMGLPVAACAPTPLAEVGIPRPVEQLQ
jgi:DNA-binding beta-propeller fold protein YncE